MKSINIRLRAIKLLKEKKEKNLHDIGINTDFSEILPKTKQQKVN